MNLSCSFKSVYSTSCIAPPKHHLYRTVLHGQILLCFNVWRMHTHTRKHREHERHDVIPSLARVLYADTHARTHTEPVLHVESNYRVTRNRISCSCLRVCICRCYGIRRWRIASVGARFSQETVWILCYSGEGCVYTRTIRVAAHTTPAVRYGTVYTCECDRVKKHSS